MESLPGSLAVSLFSQWESAEQSFLLQIAKDPTWTD